ncbi:MAG: ABC transporter ATP-binding protein [Clostridia bacterium]|nr:ABC transporter ATP-binding protein [Clostridia bacterium]
MKEQKNVYKWLNNRTAGQKAKIVWLIISNALFSALSVVFAFAIKGIIDGATNENREVGNKQLLISAVIIFAIIVLQFVFRFVINGLTEHIRGKLEISIKGNLFSQILVKKYEKINQVHSGELINRITADATIVADGVTSIIPTVISALVRLICAIIALVYLDWIFAIAFIVAGALVFLILTATRGLLKNLHKKAQETDGKTRSFMQECIENLLAIKVFSVEDKTDKKAEELQNENFKVKMKRKNVSVLGHASYNFIFSAGYVFALIYGALKIVKDVMTYGSLSAILQLVNNVQVPFASLSGIAPKYFSLIASAERIMEIEDYEEEVKSKYFNVNSVYQNLSSIEIANLGFKYSRDIVFEKANLTIDKGDFIAITGSSGIGKSTLIKLLLGVYEVEKGSLTIKGKEDIEINSSTRRLFAYVPQGNSLFSGTLKENLCFVDRVVTDEEIEKALEISCLKDFLLELPNGLNTVIGENGLGLSEGQAQRVAIARAILSKAPVLLFDEATSALDENTEEKLLSNLKNLNDVTLVIITHRKSALSICNRKVKIQSKKIVEI